MALGMGFSIAASTLVAQQAGAKLWNEVKHTASQSMFVALVMGLILGTLGYIAAPHILTLMNIPLEVYPSALKIMRIAFAATPLSFIYITYQSLMRGVGEVKRPLVIVLTTVALNAILDPFFMYGYGPFPELGVAGVMVATFITQAIAAAIALVSLFNGTHGMQISLSEFSIDKVFLRKLFFLGIPTSMEQTVRALGMTIMTVLVTAFGTTAVAAYGVGSNVLMVVIIPALGLSLAVAAFVGQNIGAGKMDRATAAVKIGSTISFLILSVLGLITFFAASHIVHFFITSGSSEVAGLAVEYVHVMAFMFGFIGLQMVFFGVFRAAGSPVSSLTLTAISQIIQFPFAYGLSRYTSLGVAGIWWSAPVANILTVILSVMWYLSGKWKKPSLTSDAVLAEVAAEEILIEEGVKKM
jgi:putative MATE family efflux protein